MEFENEKDDKEVNMEDIEISNRDHQEKKSKRSEEYADVGVHQDRKSAGFEESVDKDNKGNKINVLEVSHPSEDNDLQVVDKFQVPTHLKRTFICTLVLFFIGLILFILGFIQQISAADPAVGITFHVLGAIVMIPGGYYTYKFYKAKKARSLDERDEILEDIPEL